MNAPPPTRILHRGRRYIVRQLDAAPDDDVIINFEYWRPQPTLEGEFSGEGFFRHRGMSAIGVMAAENDWYQHDEIHEAIAAIREAVPGRRLIGYGGSMGGYGVINFADLLGLHSLVAIIPQYSIDPAKAPYETRWREDAARIDFRNDRIARAPALTRGYLVYDPWCVDGRHARDIQAHHGLSELRLYFGGHDQFRMLQQAGVFTPMLLDMLGGRFDPAAFRRSWRGARRGASAFWLELAAQIAWRGRIGSAHAAFAHAQALGHPEAARFTDVAAAIAQAEAHFAAAALPAAAEAAAPVIGTALPAPEGGQLRRAVWQRVRRLMSWS